MLKCISLLTTVNSVIIIGVPLSHSYHQIRNVNFAKQTDHQTINKKNICGNMIFAPLWTKYWLKME